MKRLNLIMSVVVFIGFSIFLGSAFFVYEPTDQRSNEVYQYRAIHDRDGIGKFYLGREIAKVMGHQEFMWLERPSREVEEQPSKIIEALNLQPTDVVADVGAGSGYLSLRMA